MKFLKRIQSIVLAAMLISSPAIVFATGPGFSQDVQNWNNSSNDDNHDQDDDTYNDDCNNEIPLDGGLSVLAAVGAAYGIKRYRDMQKK